MPIRPDGFSRESVGEARSNEMATSSVNDSDGGLATGDLPPIGVNQVV